MYKVIQSNSKGNSILYHQSILVDIGIPFAKIKPYLKDIQIVLLTHKHDDHFNKSTIKKLAFERPSVRFGCCSWMFEKLLDCGVKSRNIDVYEIGEYYNYGDLVISPIKLYHDVENCGYRIIKDYYKIFHATDTAHLNGIEAVNYDLYSLEHNYDEDTINGIIEAKTAKGEFCYEKGAINSHLSFQQANDFVFKNAGENYEVLRLHESTRYEI